MRGRRNADHKEGGKRREILKEVIRCEGTILYIFRFLPCEIVKEEFLSPLKKEERQRENQEKEAIIRDETLDIKSLKVELHERHSYAATLVLLASQSPSRESNLCNHTKHASQHQVNSIINSHHQPSMSKPVHQHLNQGKMENIRSSCPLTEHFPA